MIHIALCLTDATGQYYKNALVTAISILDNTKSNLHLHLIHDDNFAEEAKEMFKTIFTQYKQSISFYSADNIPLETINNVPQVLSKGALYRTMLPKLVEIDKILYFDCDTVCLVDIKEIFSFDISRNYMGAVKMDPWQEKAWSKKLGLTSGYCINTGVLLMNLNKIRADYPDYEEKLFSIIRTCGVKIGDQGAINILFDKVDGAFFFLPGFCNLRTEQYDHSTWPLSRYYGNIIHFAGKKPWQVLTRPGFYYWKYYSRLFPDENIFERIEALEPYENDYLYSFILSDERRRRKIRRSYDIKEKGLWKALTERLLRRRG